jgi:hypothetical protein
MSAARTARRERNREDFLRATRQGLREAGHHKLVGTAGVNAGKTFEEHLEDEIEKAVRVYKRISEQALAVDPVNNPTDPPVDSWGPQGVEHKRKAARGVIRGLCKALLIYRDSYNMDDKHALAKIEKDFLN